MKRGTKILTLVFIITVLLSIWTRSCCYHDDKYQLFGIIFLLLLVLFAMGATWLLYRKEWHQVLGFKTTSITPKVIFKSFVTSLLINILGSGIIYVVYYLIFKENPLSLFGENLDPLKLITLALVLAPPIEELLFRGFIQGLWQNLYRDKETSPTKLIIAVTALLFTISHFGFLYNVSVKQFLLYMIPLFIGALYFSYLRHKYQSIIPSMVAHFGFNSAMVVMMPILLIIFLIMPDKFNEFNRQQELAPYKNDTTSYNFDPNNMDEWERSYKKFAVLERPRSEELIKHLIKETNYIQNVNVLFTIDTCGNVCNVHLPDTVYVRYDGSRNVHRYTSDSCYYTKDGYNYSKDAINFIKSLPQCKPYMIDGKKVEKEMSESVPIYHY